MQTSLEMPATSVIPSPATLWRLALGGAAGFGFWEVFSSTATHWAAGFPLQPPELIKSLFQHQLGVSVGQPAAVLLHGLTGLLFYPIGYFVLSRAFPRPGWVFWGWTWGVMTYFIALGFFAPLAGQSFLLRDVPVLSFMSLVGHAIYGWLAALVFERLEQGV
jgi:hypothetical protein